MEQDRVRFTISVEPEVHAAFVEMAEAAGQSLSRAVGDWLRDTSAASRFVAKKMRELRMSPAAALRELAAFEEKGLVLTRDLADQVELHGIAVAPPRIAEAAERARRGVAGSVPPSSNTGGKGRTTAKGKSR